MPLKKAVAGRHANVFTAPFLCFRSFPADPSQLKTPARIKNHFPGLYCRKNHSLRPRKTTSILTGMPSSTGRTYANPSCAWKYNEKTLARQKTDMGLHWHPIVWRRSTTKGSERSKQKNVSGEMKRNSARDKRVRV